MPDGADMADSTPSGTRYLIAMLIVWALIVAAAALIAFPLMIVTLVFLALVISAAALIGRNSIIVRLTSLALVIAVVTFALWLARSNECGGFSCGVGSSVSNAPGP